MTQSVSHNKTTDFHFRVLRLLDLGHDSMGSPTGGASKSDSGSHDKLRLGADLRALLGVDFIAEDDLIAALEAAGAFIRPKGSGAQPRVLPAASPPFPAASPLPSLRLARPAAQLWALAKVASASPPSDPWDAHKLWERPTELCIRHDYDPRRRVWTASDTLAKMEDVPFGKGAMRECFRLKKMSQFNPVRTPAEHGSELRCAGGGQKELTGGGAQQAASAPEEDEQRPCCARPARATRAPTRSSRPHPPSRALSRPPQAFFYNMDWRHCANYVAKRYIAPGAHAACQPARPPQSLRRVALIRHPRPHAAPAPLSPMRAGRRPSGVGRDVYLADVQMQAEAKLWAARYNRLHPPKHVDFLTAFALEFPHRGGQLFGVERLIDGPYQKCGARGGGAGCPSGWPHARACVCRCCRCCHCRCRMVGCPPPPPA